MVDIADDFAEEKRFQELFKGKDQNEEDFINTNLANMFVSALLCGFRSENSTLTKSYRDIAEKILNRAENGIYGVDTGNGPDFTSGISCAQNEPGRAGTGDDV